MRLRRKSRRRIRRGGGGGGRGGGGGDASATVFLGLAVNYPHTTHRCPMSCCSRSCVVYRPLVVTNHSKRRAHS